MAHPSEKARSEFLIVPVLIEVRRQKDRQISLFSGVELSVDLSRGLSGYCDYVLSRSSSQITLEAPIVVIVEAQQEKILEGIGQCGAELIAAQLFNQAGGYQPAMIHGVITTGEIWKFIRLQDQELCVDLDNYYIDQIGKILGIFAQAISESDRAHG